MTLYLISERILRILSGGDVSDQSGWDIEDIKHMVVDEINLLLKTETISLNRQLGDSAPTNLVVGTYEDVTVTTWNTVQSRAVLPAIPVSLPINMGVWWVSEYTQDATRHDQFVPMQLGQWSLIKDFESLVEGGLVLGNQSYEVEGKYLVFPSDLSAITLTIKLILSDISTLGDYDLLPMPADYATEVINKVLQRFGVAPIKTDDTNDGNPQK